MNEHPSNPGDEPVDSLPSIVLEPDDLRSGIASLHPQGTVVLVLSDATDRDWAAGAVLDLCAAWAAAGQRIVVADLHLENPLLHVDDPEREMEGIVDVFLYGASLARIATPVRSDGYYLIPAGTYEPEPGEVFRHPRWRKLVAGFRETRATLLLFAPIENPDLPALSKWSSEAILLGRAVSSEFLPMLRSHGVDIIAQLVDHRLADGPGGRSAPSPEGAESVPGAVRGTPPLEGSPAGEQLDSEEFEPWRTYLMEDGGDAPTVPAELSAGPVRREPPYGSDEEDAGPAGEGDAARALPDESGRGVLEGDDAGSAGVRDGLGAGAVEVRRADVAAAEEIPDAHSSSASPGATGGGEDVYPAVPGRDRLAPRERPERGGIFPDPPEEPPSATFERAAVGSPTPPHTPDEGSSPARREGRSGVAPVLPSGPGTLSADEHEPELPPPARRRAATRRGPYIALITLLVLVVLGTVAYLVVLLRPELLPSSLEVGSAGPSAVTTRARPAPSKQGELLTYSVQVKAFTSLDAAQEQIRLEQERFPHTIYYVSPEEIQGILYYKVLAGMAADTLSAVAVRDRLTEAGAITAQDAMSNLTLLQATPLAFDLGEFETPQAAVARADSLLTAQIPSYIAQVPYSDGRDRWQLYGGAFRDSFNAEGMRQMLTAAGLSARLTARAGKPVTITE